MVIQDLPDGAWTATTEIEWSPEQNFQNAGMVVYTDEGNYLKFGMVHAGGRAFELIKEVGDAPDFLGNVAAPSEFPDAFQQRLVYDGATVSAEFSTDGASWTQVGTANLAGLDNPGVGVYATNSTVTDAFEGDRLDGCRWDRVVRYDEEMVRVADGALQVDTSPQDIFGADNTDPTNLVLQSMPDGDWTVETQMTAPLERSFQNAGFLVYGDDDNYLKAGIVALNPPGEPRVLAFEMASEIDGQVQWDDLVNDEVPDNANDEWWLRLAKEGSSYTLSWSLDGEAFTALTGSGTIELEAAAFGLYAIGTTQQQQPVTISWDCFELLGENDDPIDEPLSPL